jgi:hypothetical protein
MICTNVRQSLSAYFDDELSSEVRAEVVEHLHSCADCTAALGRIRTLSALAHELTQPVAVDLWPAIQRELHEPKVAERVPITRFGARWRLPISIVAVAASLLVGFFGWPLLHPRSAQAQMGVDLSRYVQEFRSDPASAERLLRQEYASQAIEPADAIRLVSYKPLAPEKLSDAVVRTETYLFEMPCCKCIQTLYRRPDGGALAVFEHVADEPASLGQHSTIHTKCAHKDVCVVECDGQLAVTWKDGKRFVTLVGVKDLDEANQLVPALADSST